MRRGIILSSGGTEKGRGHTLVACGPITTEAGYLEGPRGYQVKSPTDNLSLPLSLPCHDADLCTTPEELEFMDYLKNLRP